MAQGHMWLFLLIFVMLCLQMVLSMVQVKLYQKTVRGMLGTGLLGIGQRKGGFKSGEIVILSYDRQNDKVICAKSLTGLTIFAKFKELPEYAGLNLSEIREIALELDAVQLKRYRKKHPYNAEVLSKKKGALIQAVENIMLRMKHDMEKEEDVKKQEEKLLEEERLNEFCEGNQAASLS